MFDGSGSGGGSAPAATDHAGQDVTAASVTLSKAAGSTAVALNKGAYINLDADTVQKYYKIYAANSGTARLVFDVGGEAASIDLSSNHFLSNYGITIAAGDFSVPSTDSSGTPGAATIAKISGRSAIAAGASSVVITNAKINDANAKVFVQLETADTTLTSVIVTVSNSPKQFTVTGNAAATGNVVFSWFLLNAY